MQGDFFLTQGLFLGMRWLYETVTGQSIVLTIVIATIVIRALTVIGDIKSRQSSMKMQAIQPQLNKLQKKYENDPKRFQQEQQKLMKENNVSMFGGCLPMLFTMPLFFMFIAAFRQWGNEMMVHVMTTLESGDTEGAVELFKNFKFLWVNNIWQADNGFKPVITAAETLFASTNKLERLIYFKEHPEAAEAFVRLGFFVKDSTTKYGYAIAPITDEFVATYNNLLAPCAKLYEGYNNGWFLFSVICGGTTWLSTYLMQRGQNNGAQSGAANDTSKMMNWLMPVMTFVFCLTTNAAFALYWTVSNICSMGTSWLINRSFKKKAEKSEVQQA